MPRKCNKEKDRKCAGGLASKQMWSRAEICAEFQKLVEEGVLVPTGEMRPNGKGELQPVYALAETVKRAH
jgi:hypothetical protein